MVELVTLKGLPTKSKSTSDIIKESTKAIKTSLVEGDFKKDGYFIFHFNGARIVPLNVILNADRHVLTSYKKACHDAIERATLQICRRKFNLCFNDPVQIKLCRVGKKLMDIDGFFGGCKFFIDGLRKSGIIIDDNPNAVTHLMQEQSISNSLCKFTIAVFTKENRHLFE